MGQQQSAEGLLEGGEGISPGLESMMEGLGTLGDDVTDKLIASLPLVSGLIHGASCTYGKVCATDAFLFVPYVLPT